MSKEGGYILLARALDNSEVMKKPPHFREIWLYFLRKAAWKDTTRYGVKLKRGELLTSYKEIIDALSWKVGARTNCYKKHDVDHAIRYFRESDTVATAKATGMVKITILKYNEYQTSESYESDSDSDTKGDRGVSIPYIRRIKHKYTTIKLPKNFPLDQFVEYEIARMNGKKDGRKKWDDKERRSAIKTFLSLKDFINELKLDGHTGLNSVLKTATENNWRGFSYYKKTLRGIRERQKQARKRYQADKEKKGRPQPKLFTEEMMR